ncbi:MAG: T9SS type A sorting domain-containing protein [Chitinophagaceae bacterium]
MKTLFTSVFLGLGFIAFGQNYNPAKTNWQDAGYRGTKPTFSTVLNILNYGADNTGILSCNHALDSAIYSLNAAPGVILFPNGQYYFDQKINLSQSNIVLRGAGYDSSKLIFNLHGRVSNLINISGSSTNDTSSFSTDAIRGNFSAIINNPANFHAGDWVYLSMNDSAFMTSSWAYGSLGQTMQIQSVSGNSIIFKSPFRFNYFLSKSPKIRRIIPVNSIGFECLKIQRMDSTAGQSSNIAFTNAVNCWINGIESYSCNFAHVELNYSSNIEVTNSYFHGAFGYGGGGQGYGVLIQFATGECKVEGNYFNHLRHSMVLQAGANGNVLAYNYSTHPYWTEPSLPDSAAGEIVLHGNFPFSNLAEGNFVNNIVIDDSHGKNGPLNTFFRNRASGYGIFMNFSPATDSQQFIGNEITNTNIGLNFINGKGHFLYGNNYRGAVVDGSTSTPDSSLYLLPEQRPDCFSANITWPVVGTLTGYNQGTIYAKARVEMGHPAACSCVTIPTGFPTVLRSGNLEISPNPARESFEIKALNIQEISVYGFSGRQLISLKNPANNKVDVTSLAPGLYLVRIQIQGQEIVRKLTKL